MTNKSVSVRQQFKAPVHTVFGALSDHNRLGEVLGVPVRRVRDGAGNVNGVGSARALGFWPMITEETVTAIEENKSIDYRITKGGAPLRNHRGRVAFRENPAGAEVEWTITFDAPPIVGTMVCKVLTAGIRIGLTKLSRNLQLP
jgi:hypothetical protein